MIRSRRAWLGLACLVCLLTRAPALRYSVISDDEAIYDAMAQTIGHGGVMYRDTVDHKPPGLVYSYAAVERLARAVGGGEGGELPIVAVHLAGLCAVLLTCLALAGIARRLLPAEAALWPPLLYAIVSAAKQPVDALAVNGELLMNLPTALAVWAALTAAPARGMRRVALDFACGALVAVAALFKYQAAVVGLALPLLLVGERPARSASRVLAWLAGAALPLALCLQFFHARGALDDALAWGIDFNRHYLSDGPGLAWAAKRLALQLVGVVLPGALLYGCGLLTLGRLCARHPRAHADLAFGRAFLVGWSLLALASVGLGGRFFGHYFLQPELPLALLAAAPIARLFARAPRITVAALALPALLFTAVAASPERSARLFHEIDYSEIGRAVAARTAPAETIWVWGNAPQIYHAAHRRQGVRFTFCNYLTGLSPATPSEYDAQIDPRRAAVPLAWRQVFDDLDHRRPALIVDTAPADLKSYGKFPISAYPDLSRYLAAHYRSDGAVGQVQLYRRVD